MVALVATLVFALALAASVMVFLSTLIPAWPRIVMLLRHGADAEVPLPPQPVVSRLRPTIRPIPVRSVQPAWRVAA